MPNPVRSDLLAIPGIANGFFTREGGVSTGIYAGLNAGLGSGDDRAAVEENRLRIAAALGIEKLARIYQVHSADVVVVDGSESGEPAKADGVVTATPGVGIGIVTADCGPVLFADENARIVGACHAGWKGALTGVLENTIDAMIGLGAERAAIRATLGPTISHRAYEVGPDFPAPFTERDADAARFFTPSTNEGHHMFDLPAYIGWRLGAAEIRAEILDICTYGDEDRFFSYRRTTHRGEADYGRQLSAIAITTTEGA